MAIFFWGHSEKYKYGCFSQWSNHSFTDHDGTRYQNAEQYMMAQKARLFGDTETHEQIMSVSSPKQVKALGRKVRGYNQSEWERRRSDIVYNGNFLKFSQNPKLSELLKSTGDAIIAEASPVDAIWGIGLSEQDAKQVPESEWPGQNLLGKALMEVRGNL